MRKLFLIFVLLFMFFALIAQENPLEMRKEQLNETEKERVVFESILKDADFYPFMGESYWVLKFENCAVVRIPVKPIIHWVREIFWIGRKYQVIVSEAISYFEVREIKEKKEEKEKK